MMMSSRGITLFAKFLLGVFRNDSFISNNRKYKGVDRDDFNGDEDC